MIKEALEYLVGLQKKADHRIFNDGVRHFIVREEGDGVDPLYVASIDTLHLSTLSGIVTWFKDHPDEFKEEDKPYIQVFGYSKVLVYSKPGKIWLNRLCPVKATTDDLDVCQFKFGQQYNAEDFIVEVQKNFLPTDVRDQLLHLVGNISSDEVITADDDGISQKVATRVSASFKGQAKLPNPLVLKPYRTFLEIDQPESTFVLRAQRREGNLPTLALHLADGGQWKLVAISRIHDYLKKQLPEVTILA